MNYLSAEYLTSPSVIDELKKKINNVQAYKNFDGTYDRKAAVLIAFCQHDNGQMSLLYTLRSSQLKSHAGQVAFPGGKADPTDSSATDTALRETEEEIGIPRSAIEIWGEFVGLPGIKFDMIVIPVIGLIRNFDHLIMRPNKLEVEDVFSMPLEKLCDPHYFGFNYFKNQYTMPVYMGGQYKIWGITASFTDMVLSCLFPEHVYSCRIDSQFRSPSISQSKM